MSATGATIVYFSAELEGTSAKGPVRLCAMTFGPGQPPFFIYVEEPVADGWRIADTDVEAAARRWLAALPL